MAHLRGDTPKSARAHAEAAMEIRVRRFVTGMCAVLADGASRAWLIGVADLRSAGQKSSVDPLAPGFAGSMSRPWKRN